MKSQRSRCALRSNIIALIKTEWPWLTFSVSLVFLMRSSFRVKTLASERGRKPQLQSRKGQSVCASQERTWRAVLRLREDSVLALESSHDVTRLMSRKAPIGVNQNLRGELKPSIGRFITIGASFTLK